VTGQLKTWWYGPDTEIVLCENGLHQSIDPLDALRYGKGHFWCCTPGGTIVYGEDKLASSERTHHWRVADTGAVLRHFARLCALDVVDKIEAPPAELDIILRWLRTGDEALCSAAYSAAYSAACSAARSATYPAARSAARSAERSAACSAAYSAARSAAHYAAHTAAFSAAHTAARSAACYAARFEAHTAAHTAAYSTAYFEALAKQAKRLHRMLMEAERVTG